MLPAKKHWDRGLAPAIRASGKVEGLEKNPTSDEIGKEIEHVLGTDDEKLFPGGKGSEPRRMVRGSELLRRILADYELRYHKKNTGRLIAENITRQNQDGLEDLWNLVGRLFADNARSGQSQ